MTQMMAKAAITTATTYLIDPALQFKKRQTTTNKHILSKTSTKKRDKYV